MDHIISKYQGKKGKNPFDFTELKKMTPEQKVEGMEQYYGLEEIVKHLNQLSNSDLKLTDIRAP